MIRVMVVDDEPLARESLSRLISASREFEISVQATSGKDALHQFQRHLVDVVFLDIEMPGMDGLETASRLSALEKPPYIVFATAYHQYAVKAFEAHAIDYILKPYDPARIKKTLERIQQLVPESSEFRRENLISLENDLIQKGILKKIVGHKKNSKDRVVLSLEDVCYFSVQYSEVLAHLEHHEDIVVNATLKELFKNLDAGQFAQTHKSHIVNINKIEKISPMFSGNFEITLKNSTHSKIPLSRRFAKNLKNRLANW